MNHKFELCLFNVDPVFVKAAFQAGIDIIIVDWENKGKQERQKKIDTQINYHTVDDLRAVRKATRAHIICRINPIDTYTLEEIDAAILNGADEILIPMVQSTKEVAEILEHVKEKTKMGILIETNQAIQCAKELSQLPLERIYVGLNDLSIENQTRNIFTPIANGVLDKLRNSISLPFGFGGLTLPDRGHPIPSRLLLGEMIRLKCQFSFLRRSFLADVKGKNLSFEVGRIKEALKVAQDRSDSQIYSDHQELIESVSAK